jgi:hypothetical protein
MMPGSAERIDRSPESSAKAAADALPRPRLDRALAKRRAGFLRLGKRARRRHASMP